MTQNIYDDPDFFSGYAQLPRSQQGLKGAPEWPALCRLLPSIKQLTIIDLGCGYGWFCRYAEGAGAKMVIGLDVSEKMLERAKKTSTSSVIRYQLTDLENFSWPISSLDLAYSSLTLHYLENLQGLLSALYQALRPGSWFIFSVEHHIYTAPSRPDWIVDSHGDKIWPLNHYQREGSRITHWMVPGVVKQHRTLGSYLNLLINQGFIIQHVEEWQPDKQQLAAMPSLFDEQERPMLLLVAVQRPK